MLAFESLAKAKSLQPAVISGATNDFINQQISLAIAGKVTLASRPWTPRWPRPTSCSPPDRCATTAGSRPWVLVIPALAWLLVFNLWPSINTVILSFTNAKPIGGGTFVGLKNFEALLHDEQLRWALLNSVIYMVVCLPFLTILPLLLAVLVEKKLPGITFFRTAFYTPVVASAVVVALIWQWILDDRGLVNGLAEKLGVISGPLPFLSPTSGCCCSARSA